MSKLDLKNIANGLLGTFVSRNNDIDGYWGIGMLRRIADEGGLETIELDLLKSERDETTLSKCKSHYRNWLEKALARRDLPLESISMCCIRLTFYQSFEEFPDIIKDTRGFPFRCSVEIRSEDMQKQIATTIGVCEPHSQSRESRSARQ